MSKKKRILVFIIVILLITCISASVIGILNSDTKETNTKEKEEIPKITENYKEVELISKYKSENHITYDDETSEILETINFRDYIIGSNGSLNNDKIIKEYDYHNKDYIESKNYKFFLDEDNYCYYINTKTNEKSKSYLDIIIPRKDKLTGIYAILVSDDERSNKTIYEVLNTNTGNITKLDLNEMNIISDQSIYTKSLESNGNAISINYFKIINTNNKFGLIDHTGKIIIDVIYDDIDIFEDKYIIASNNNKYGIVNFKNEEVIPFEYDKISHSGKYLILIKNNKISIASSNAKIFIDSKIDCTNQNKGYEVDNNYSIFTTKVYNNKLYLVVYYNKKLSIYLINNKNIERKISTTTEFIDLYSDKNKYIYTIENNSDEATITFYDYDLYEYYKISLPINKNITYTYEIDQLENKNNYSINIYNEDATINDYYYIDLFNSKEIDERTALTTYFKNGYNFYISSDNKLKIYKNNELLNEFEGEYRYLGGYLFKKDNEIFEVIFKKDSTTK